MEGEEYGPRPIKVYCKCIGELVPEDSVIFLDISEGPQGEDLLTFDCPHCDGQHTSRRLG